MRPKIFARLLVAFVLAASPAFVSLGCSKPDLGKTAGARLSPRADGGADLVVDGWPLAGLSREDVAGRATIELSYVPGSDAVAFRTVDGKWVNLVALGPIVKRGPVADAPQDFSAVVGGLVATDPDAANVLSQVRAAKGKTAVAAVLGKAAAAEGKTWEERLEALSEEERRELVKVLEGALLDLTSPPRVVTRALALVDVAALPEEKLLARVEPAVISKDAKEPEGTFVASVVLRVLAQKKSAGKLACKGLTSRTWKLDEPSPDRRLLLDAMLMAVANEDLDCPAVDALIQEEPCASTLRCGGLGPVLPNATSDQREPLCGPEALEKAVELELGRAPKAVLKDPHPGRTSGYALAAQVLGKRPPLADLEKRHARRLFTITQPKTPECDAISGLGKPCHADESVLRDHACRNEGDTIAVGTIKFRVSVEKKTIDGVETAPAP